MSPIKETAIRMIEEIPDDKIVYILHIIKGINGLYDSSSSSAKNKLEAYQDIQQFRGKIPADMNYDDELENFRTGRYASND